MKIAASYNFFSIPKLYPMVSLRQLSLSYLDVLALWLGMLKITETCSWVHLNRWLSTEIGFLFERQTIFSLNWLSGLVLFLNVFWITIAR